jgi:hypothetical protein
MEEVRVACQTKACLIWLFTFGFPEATDLRSRELLMADTYVYRGLQVPAARGVYRLADQNQDDQGAVLLILVAETPMVSIPEAHLSDPVFSC